MFRSACVAYGLTADDSDCDKFMEESSVYLKGPALRRAFAMVLMHSDVAEPQKLLDRHIDVSASNTNIH